MSSSLVSKLSTPLLVCSLGALPACGPLDPGSSTGGARAGVMNSVLFARADAEGVSSGFDLDGSNTLEGDQSGCGIPDFVSPEGQAGVDNAFARLIPALELTEAIAAEDLLDDTINSGELLLVIEVSGLDDEWNDDEVDVRFLRGVGPALLGSSDELLPSQTFASDPEVDEVLAVSVPLIDGVVVADNLQLSIPLDIFQYHIIMDLTQASLRIELLDGGGFRGYFGGAYDYSLLLEVTENSELNPTLIAALPPLLDSAADMVGSDGRCSNISTTIEYEALPAFVF